MPTVVLLGTLDTKGIEYDYLRTQVQKAGCDVLMIDAGSKGEPLTHADISNREVAQAVGADIGPLSTTRDRGTAVETMARGATGIAQELFKQGSLHGTLGLGGSAGSSPITQARRSRPLVSPKL